MRYVRLLVAALAAVMAVAAVGSGPAYATPTPDGVRQMLVLRTTWPGANDGLSADLDGVLTNTVNPWMRSVSSTIFSGWNVTDPGGLSIVKPPPGPGGPCDNTFLASLRQGAEQAAEEHGINVSTANWDVIVYWFPFTQCGWSGLGDLLGAHVYLNGTVNPYSIIHELGHHVGLGHAHGLECHDGNGNPVTLSASCGASEYGDPITVMGGGVGTYSAIQLADLGWLNGLVTDVPATGGEYLVTPLESPSPGTGTHALRISDGSETVWVEYRQPINADAGFPNQQGVFVYLRRPDQYTAAGSYQLNLGLDLGTPGHGLPVGRSWTNPLGHLRLTVDYAEPSAAHVVVSSTLATVPNVLSDDESVAKSAITSAGLSVGKVSHVKNCVDPGTVQSQSPAPDTRVEAQTPVYITVSTCSGGGIPK